MTSIFTPLIDLTLAVLAALAICGLVVLVGRVYRRGHAPRHFRVAELEGDLESLTKILRSVDPPFALEIAVHHLGKNVHFYLVLPAIRAQKFFARAGLVETSDYNIYHPGGAHLASSLAAKGASTGCIEAVLQILKETNFHKVNEVGEGAVFQLVAGSKGRGGSLNCNARLVVSAPTPYQAREITSDLDRELSGCKWTEEKSKDFITAVTYREFDPASSTAWTLS